MRSKVSYIEHSLKIVDLDEDGTAEVLFLYEIAPRKLAPVTLKLMLHSKGKKLSIRGTVPRREEDKQKYQMQVDPLFSKYPERFLHYATQQWLQAIDTHYKIEK